VGLGKAAPIFIVLKQVAFTGAQGDSKRVDLNILEFPRYSKGSRKLVKVR
jgi:hypothetical protein